MVGQVVVFARFRAEPEFLCPVRTRSRSPLPDGRVNLNAVLSGYTDSGSALRPRPASRPPWIFEQAHRTMRPEYPHWEEGRSAKEFYDIGWLQRTCFCWRRNGKTQILRLRPDQRMFFSASASPTADTLPSRLKLLIGRHTLRYDEGLWIVPSTGFHTFSTGMTAPIDLVYLDEQHRVRSYRRVVPQISIGPHEGQCRQSAGAASSHDLFVANPARQPACHLRGRGDGVPAAQRAQRPTVR